MFSRQNLDLLILSILHHHKDPKDIQNSTLSGYAITKSINDRFGLNVSTGTIYPKLKKLVGNGFIIENEPKKYSITKKGVKEVEEQTPEFFKSAIKHLPDYVKYFSKVIPGSILSKLSTHLPFSMDKMTDFECFCTHNVGDSIDNLKKYRENLISQKQKIEEKIIKIDQKIKEVEEEKKSWTKINIMDDFNEEDE